MRGCQHCFVLCALISVFVADAAYFIPKSFYVIDRTGHQSDTIYLSPRVRRGLPSPNTHLMFRRSAGGAGSSSSSSSYSSSDSFYFGNPAASSFSTSSSSSSSGAGFGPGQSFGSAFENPSGFQQGGYSGVPGGLGGGLHSRFADTSDAGPGIRVSGTSQGGKGVYSSSSSSIDSDGKVTYNVQTGKF